MVSQEEVRRQGLLGLGFSERIIDLWDNQFKGNERKKPVTAGAIQQKAERLKTRGFEEPLTMMLLEPEIVDLSLKRIDEMIEKMEKVDVTDPIDTIELFPSILIRSPKDIDTLLRYAERLERFGVNITIFSDYCPWLLTYNRVEIRILARALFSFGPDRVSEIARLIPRQ